jgi:hypothetical protein
MQDTIKGLAEKYSWITPIYESVIKLKKEQEAFASVHVNANNGVYTVHLAEHPF